MTPKSLQHLFTRSICPSCRAKRLRISPLSRPFSSTAPLTANDKPLSESRQAPNLSPLMSGLRSMYNETTAAPPQPSRFSLDDLSSLLEASFRPPAHARGYGNRAMDAEPHHLHVYATKHNCHITLTRPSKDAIVSLSAGNIGFRKGQRGSFDAAFQLAAYVMRSIQERGLLRAPTAQGAAEGAAGAADGVEEPIRSLEIVFRGFGDGREAVTKALLGNEGRLLRGKVVKVADATRLKFGGTRSPNPRRLG